ncbi:MAG: NAD+ synthase, partial [Thermodesulfobacteriota bacterium]
MRIALLQVNPRINDLAANAAKIISQTMEARSRGADLCVTPELALIGYPPKDFLLYSSVIEKCYSTAQKIAASIQNVCPLILGMPVYDADRDALYNAAALLESGKILALSGKTLLPNYDVFEESRYFQAYPASRIFEINGRRLGITICEDIWNDKTFWRSPRYEIDPVQDLRDAGAEIILNLSASPFTIGKQKIREKMLLNTSERLGLPILYCNQCGGNDDLVFDGFSLACAPDKKIFARARGFNEDLLIADLENFSQHLDKPGTVIEEEAWEAMVLGCRDYARKCGFQKIILGISGGVDSALSACIAAQALGADNVLGVMLPSPFTSRESIDDAYNLAGNLGFELINLPISRAMHEYSSILDPVFSGLPADVTEENIQARIRGNILMALANKFGGLLITTGNKSEIAVGYCTIYGDMAGGLGLLSDVPKTMVYAIAYWLNRTKGEKIPVNIL